MSCLLNVNDPKFGDCIQTIIDESEHENNSNKNIYSDDSLSETEPDNVEIDNVVATNSKNQNDVIPQSS